MTERREGIDPQRAEKLEATINTMFSASGIAETPDEVMLRYIFDATNPLMSPGRIVDVTPHEALDMFLGVHGFGKSARLDVMRMLGELYGAGTDGQLDQIAKNHLEKVAPTDKAPNN